MEPDQVDVVAAAMFRHLQQVLDAVEPRFAGQIVGDVFERHRLNRVHDDVAVVHPVATTGLDAGGLPDANAASDSPAPDSFAKAFGEHHVNI